MKALRAAALLAVLAAAAAALWRSAPPPAPASAIGPADSATARGAAADESKPAAPARAAPDAVIAAPAERAAPAHASVVGRVRDTSGTPLEGIAVIAETRTANGLRVAGSNATSDSGGEFRFDDLMPGRLYSLTIEPQQNHAAYSLDSFTAGRSEQLPDILLQPLELVDIDGMVVDADRLPVADFEFRVFSLASEFPERVLRSDSSGFFSLRGFPAGEIGIATGETDYFRIQGLALRADTYRNLTLVIDRGSYYLGGWVSDASGVPLGGAQITLQSSLAGDGYHSFSYRTTVADQSGAFEFAQLGGNRATLNVLADGYETHVEEHEFASFADSIAVRLRRLEP